MKSSRSSETRGLSEKAIREFPLMSVRQFKFMAFIYLPLCLLFCGFVAWSGVRQKEPSLIWIAVVGVLAFLFIYYFMVKIKNSKLAFDSKKIVLSKGDGSSISLPWDQISSVREQWGSACLVAQGASSQLRIRILPSTENFDRVREKVLAEWERHRTAPVFPAVFRAFPFRSLRVDSNGIEARLFFRKTVLSWREIQKVQWGLLYYFDPRIRLSLVQITARDGRVLKLRRWWGNLPEIYLALRKGLGPKRRGGSEEFEGPIHLSEEKLSKNLWFAALAGIVWALVPGFFIGRIFIWKPFWLFMCLQIFVLLVFPYWALKREAVLSNSAEPREEIHPSGAALLVVFSFLAGFLIAPLVCVHWGDQELRQAKARITAAGYDIEMPANDPKVPDPENAVYYLQKANQVPSAVAQVSPSDRRQSTWDMPIDGKKIQE